MGFGDNVIEWLFYVYETEKKWAGAAMAPATICSCFIFYESLRIFI